MANTVEVSLKIDNSLLAKEEVRKAIDRALEAIGLHVSGEAKEELSNAPKRIDTGLLRNSITYAVYGQSPAVTSYTADTGEGAGSYSGKAPGESDGGMAVYIGSNSEYSAYVHEGTQKMAPNRFLKNAVEKNLDQIQRYIEREIQDAFS